MLTVAAASGRISSEALRQLHRTGQASSHAAIRVVDHLDVSVIWRSDSTHTTWNDDGNVLVVLDGYVHNLASPTQTQVELLSQRYQMHGRELARGLHGDFVIVILDRTSDGLVVARDPLGVRPWYEAISGREYGGASQFGILASLAWTDTTIDEEAVVRYLAALSENEATEIYRGIRALPAGHTRWWRPDSSFRFAHHEWNVEAEVDLSWDEGIERSRALLDTAVCSRLNAGMSSTSELSGGLDSSAIVGTLSTLRPHNLIVGRMEFDGRSADERQYSTAVAEHWGLEMISVPPWNPSSEENAELTRTLRRPIPDPHFTMFASLQCAFQASGRRTAFTGLGGDDAFIATSAGSRVVSAFQLRRWSVIADIARTAGRDPRSAWRTMLGPAFYRITNLVPRDVPYWVAPHSARAAGIGKPERPLRVTGIAAVDERLTSVTSPWDAGILESRAAVCDLSGHRDTHPFLDPDFITGTYGLDPWWPAVGGHTRALQAAAYRDRLPTMVADRRSKAEFSVAFWDQLLDAELLEDTRTGPLSEHGWLDRDGFERLVENAKSGKANSAIPLSRCIGLNRFMRSI